MEEMKEVKEKRKNRIKITKREVFTKVMALILVIFMILSVSLALIYYIINQ